MSSGSTWRLWAVLFVAVLGFWFLAPTIIGTDDLPAFLPQKQLNLGLDLQGGLHLELKVETQKAVENALSQRGEQIKRDLREKRIRIRNFNIRPREIRVSVRGEEGADELTKHIEDEYPGLEVTGREAAEGDYVLMTMGFIADEVAEIERYAIDQGIETIRNRIDQFGVSEPVIIPQGDGEILIQLPGLGSMSAEKVADRLRKILEEDAIEGALVESKGSEVHVTLDDEATAEALATKAVEKIIGISRDGMETTADGKVKIVLGLATTQRAKRLIGQTAQLEFRMIDESIDPLRALETAIPPDSEILYGKADIDPRTGKAKPGRDVYLARKTVSLTGDVITEARMAVDGMRSQYYVVMEFDRRGSKLFGEITTEAVGKRMAIVLDGVVQSAPVIREAITGGRASISGTFTRDEARDLAISLRSGSLPAPVSVMHEIEVGATLGDDSIEAGKLSLMVGMFLVVLFMGVYYKAAGLLADAALLLNIVLILGALAAFGATLTLPGIAGLVLTIGMAVDANVLIFERIREELRQGKSPLRAVESGYEKAFSTIIDANVTTLIAAIVLGWLGTGPIRGFAITLGIGILSSMFTAVVGTRAGFELFLVKSGSKKLSI
jgi:protein-export membrane protein SecD